MNRDRGLELLSQFSSVVRQVEPRPEFVHAPQFPSDTLHFSSMTFDWLAQEQLRQMANAVSEFSFRLTELRAWTQVLSPLDEGERAEVAFELVHPTAVFCLQLPYMLKARFCRSIAELSHQANRFRSSGWRDDVDFGRYGFKIARRHAAAWDSWAAVEDELALLNDGEFVHQVYDFRNEFHHGFPRGIELGTTQTVHRSVDGRSVSYAFGIQPPLTLEGMLPGLTRQNQAALSVYRAYSALVVEQRAVVAEKCRVDG